MNLSLNIKSYKKSGKYNKYFSFFFYNINSYNIKNSADLKYFFNLHK